ncbi:hypothetical protein FRC02_006678 [Tulasnella sp. 418]|nr:hypothetical protein FRC02_006678 [Tulasnella sp. 418]
MRLSITYVTALFTLISSVVIARPTSVLDSWSGIQADSPSGTVPYTNAQRFARGLPPIKPARHRGGALRPRASPGICSNSDIHRGRIKLTTSDGRIRYVKAYNSASTLGLDTTDDASQAIQVSLIYDGTSPPSYFRIERRDSSTNALINFGASAYTTPEFTSTTEDVVLFSALVASNPNSLNSPASATKVASTVEDKIQWSESVIWSIGADNLLTMTWFNPAPTASVVMMPFLVDQWLYYAPNIDLANAYASPPGNLVTMQFECLPVEPPMPTFR